MTTRRIRLIPLAACMVLCRASSAAEPVPLPQHLVESFTRSIQPLLLNRCATAGCHAGSKGSEPMLRRHNLAGQIDRGLTLANIDSLRRAADTPEKARAQVASLAVAHPSRRDPPPLSTSQMNVLRSWLVAACEAENEPEAAAASPTTANRFREMLDAARNPAPLWPPPRLPGGVILKDDPPENGPG